MDCILTDRHSVRAEELVDVVEQALCGVSEIYGVLCLELSDDLLCKNIVKSLDLFSSAAYVYGDIGLYLLHDTVTECDMEVLNKILIKLLKSLHVSVGYGVLSHRFPCKRSESLSREMDGLCSGSYESLRLGIKVEDHRSVVYLIGYSKRGVVVVSRTDKPHVYRKLKSSVSELCGVVIPLVGYNVNVSFVGIGKLEK